MTGVTLAGTDAIDYDMANDQTTVEFSTVAEAQLFLTAGRYTVANPNAADPNAPGLIVQNPFTFQREGPNDTELTVTVPEGTGVEPVTGSTTSVIFDGINLESISPTSAAQLELEVLLDRSLSGHVGLESSDGTYYINS